MDDKKSVRNELAKDLLIVIINQRCKENNFLNADAIIEDCFETANKFVLKMESKIK